MKTLSELKREHAENEQKIAFFNVASPGRDRLLRKKRVLEILIIQEESNQRANETG